MTNKNLLTDKELSFIFASQDAEYAAMCAKGFDPTLKAGLEADESMNRSKSKALFLQLALQFYLDKIDYGKVNTPLLRSGVIEINDYEGKTVIQRMAIDAVKSVQPVFNTGETGQSIDPFVKVNPETTERFFNSNIDYTGLVSIPDEQVINGMFRNSSEMGVSIWASSVVEKVKQEYQKQLELTASEAIGTAILSDKWPLQETQIINTKYSRFAADREGCVSLVSSLMLLKEEMSAAIEPSAWNAMKYSSYVDPESLTLLVRPGLLANLNVYLNADTYNPNAVRLPFKVVAVRDFGLKEPYADKEFKTRLYPVYDNLGTNIGFSEEEGKIGKSNVTYSEDMVNYKDLLVDTEAVLIEDGAIFSDGTEKLRFQEPIHNPRGLYNNLFCHVVNGHLHLDPIKNMIVINGDTKKD